MKYNVGDMLLIKNFEYRPRPRLRLHPRLHARLHPHPHLRIFNTLGIITAVESHSDIFERDSTEDDNGYIWYSQVDGQEYYFYENEVEGEVIR